MTQPTTTTPSPKLGSIATILLLLIAQTKISLANEYGSDSFRDRAHANRKRGRDPGRPRVPISSDGEHWNFAHFDNNNDPDIEGIIGGEEIEPHSRPYLVVTGIEYYGAICAGTLITPQVVLTAAHCNTVWVDDEWYWDPPTYVEINRHSLYENEGVVRMNLVDTSESSSSSDIAVHPEFDNDLLSNDVALIFLPLPISGVPLVKMQTDSSMMKTGDPVNIVGWGMTQEFNFSSTTDVPMEADTNYLDSAECEVYFEEEGWEIYPSNMCIKSDSTGTCYGDSGAPHLLGSPEGGPIDPPIQIGITSWGFDGCDLNYPSIGTRVSSVAGWVMETVCERTGEMCTNVNPPTPPPVSGKSGKNPQPPSSSTGSPTTMGISGKSGKYPPSHGGSSSKSSKEAGGPVGPDDGKKEKKNKKKRDKKAKKEEQEEEPSNLLNLEEKEIADLLGSDGGSVEP